MNMAEAAGVIPAQAGRTTRGACGRSGTRGHPRAGGADSLFSVEVVVALGSSPRRRGGPASTASRNTRAGVIPAQAGRTTCPVVVSMWPWGHPRAGGADTLGRCRAARRRGSSPRRRGGLMVGVHPFGSRGVIPAQAGRTGRLPGRDKDHRGHPRAGGADRLSSRAAPRHGGSSPRRRGGPGATETRHGPEGVIPAQAGRTRANAPCAEAVWGHPRAGGADAGRPATSSLDAGSSPRRRGGRWPCWRRCVWCGVIPAQAGRTVPAVVHASCWRGHPRAGGADMANTSLGAVR